MTKPEITAVIVEDIKEFHSVIETFLSEVAPHVRIVGNATTLAKAEELIIELSPQLLFLDIQFEAEGKTSFDLLCRLAEQQKYNFQIIIISAFNQGDYYAEAFNFRALHFLTKPIDKQKLKEAVLRVNQNLNGEKQDHEKQYQWVSQLQQLHTQLHGETTSKKIIIDGLNYTEVVHTKDIVYLEASGRYTYIYLQSNELKPVCSSVNLGEYEKKLQHDSVFFRIHRNAIVNTNYIVKFSKKDYSIILPAPFDKIYASKDRFKEFRKYMEDLIDL